MEAKLIKCKSPKYTYKKPKINEVHDKLRITKQSIVVKDTLRVSDRVDVNKSELRNTLQ